MLWEEPAICLQGCLCNAVQRFNHQNRFFSINRAYSDAQNRLLWTGTTCLAHTYLIMSQKAKPIIIIIIIILIIILIIIIIIIIVLIIIIINIIVKCSQPWLLASAGAL